MADVFVVLAVDCEDYEIRGVLTDRDAAIEFARDQEKRERRRRYGGDQIVVKKHRLDPKLGSRLKGRRIEHEDPADKPVLPIGVAGSGFSHIGSAAAYPMPITPDPGKPHW